MTCLRIVNETECDVILRRAQALRGTLKTKNHIRRRQELATAYSVGIPIDCIRATDRRQVLHGGWRRHSG